MPKLSRVAVLWDPTSGPLQLTVEAASKVLNVTLEILQAGTLAEIDDAFLTASGKGIDAILMLSSPVFGTNPERVAGLTLGLRLPAVSLFPSFARAGGMMAYGVDPPNIFRQGAGLVAKVLRGAKPADLPAELPTKFELVVNLKTAKRLGMTFPTSILLRADEVIE
jgi:putative ABC transport system substrate-binding protein